MVIENPIASIPQSDLRNAFINPPWNYSPVPFYWWAGEKLDRGRIAWQLDQLCQKGVRRVVISYPHSADGSTDVGDPAIFSTEWWDLFRWFLSACRERGMTAGIQDYTIVGPILQSIGDETADMQGGRMSCVSQQACGGSVVRITCEPGAHVIGAWAYAVRDGKASGETHIELSDAVRDGQLEWVAPAGDWLVVLVFARLNAFDPMHPNAGCLAIDRLYVPFERECPGEVGRTLDLFFQDELDFGARMPFWSNCLFSSFAKLKGYDVAHWLPALWHDLGPLTEKIRLDYADVVTRRIEDCYFKPVFHWHESRGTLLGHDNGGRGGVAEGRAHYGDYFRAMRWFSAPGCDDPRIQGARAFRGLKVNSSIAHLFGRPRVWLEAFHSSGWGTNPAEIITALHENFVYGANLVNPHGLYYSTHGGWWEWAPPDVHFRQPYWRHAGSSQLYLTRMSWLLSQGVHQCDVAILYPTDAIDAQAEDPSFHHTTAHTGNGVVSEGDPNDPQPEETAFALGKFLFDHACDFDFIDSDSLASGETGDGELKAGETRARYRVLVIPAMSALRHGALEMALKFALAGGLVIAFGRLPLITDLAGREDNETLGLLTRLFGVVDETSDLRQSHPGGGHACFFRRGYSKVLETITHLVNRDIQSTQPLQVLHRTLGAREVFFLFNPSDEKMLTEVCLRSPGTASQWNSWTGEVTPLGSDWPMSLAFGPGEAKLIIIETGGASNDTIQSPVALPISSRMMSLDGDWQFSVLPTLDNRYGDFHQPASNECLGPEARTFRWADEMEESEPWQSPEFDDESWPQTTFSFGQRLEFVGPLSPENRVSPFDRPDDFEWEPYSFSLRWGIERDPFLTHWLSGPHGLKGQVPDEFLDFHSETEGAVWYLRTKVVSKEAREAVLVSGGRCIYQIWMNGETAVVQPEAEGPGLHPPWGIPHYECTPRETRVLLREGVNEVFIKLVQPIGQRTRAFFTFDPLAVSSETLGLRWFTEPSVPRPSVPASGNRKAIRFRCPCPPGVMAFTFTARGKAMAWVNGEEVVIDHLEELPNQCHRYRATIKTPSPGAGILAIRIEAPPESRAGDALPEPIHFECGQGTIQAGDWCDHGLATYSGIGEYRRTITLKDADLAGSVMLDPGEIGVTAEVRVNGQTVATLISAPWQVDLTPHLRAGKNELVIAAANTLANHYSVGIPTPYAFPEQTRSGLLGPVRLIFSHSLS